ncbi:MAG TPA: PAC2 family protein [Phycicoccus elongatus]|uniref:PAC2 family protein n=1 Tax=Phycicoccus TaxID=367298 RepID=UPI001D5A7D42|nr:MULTISPECIES: PAC2 family protein [Phycicoccus]MBK8730098.1 PAC2 family protein [Tetrasphaera sp.]MCB1238905.1 PAC2 family protein [Tetrasphaera sp.]MCB9405817.1 PAC2 family protein [Tetrasphaera sp.]MCO5303930.1 PAC2 family protein [Phycicoccus sp.]HPF75866.1 PAC2 family protein [Phycicoccus elongatus]
MQNPSSLYHFETDGTGAVHQPGVLLVLLGAFIDAGNIQRTLGSHLLETGEPQIVASFDVDQLLDYRGRRPMMVFDADRWVSYDDPAILLHRLTDRDGQTYYVLTGPEPDYQWERFIEALRQVMDVFGITLAVSAHGIPMGVPHTRPVGMTAHATDPRLIGEAQSPFGRVQVPGSLPALLELRLGESGREALGFAVHVPHYLAQAEWAEGALAVLNAVVDHTGLNLPNDDLIAKAGANTREIASELSDNTEAAQLVQALEQQYDTFMEGKERPSLLATEASELPSAEELGAEFEQFLRNNPEA